MGRTKSKNTRTQNQGVIHLSYLNILGVDLIPHLIRDYQRANPKITFELTQGDKGKILAHVESGYSDVMITSERPINETFEWIPILSLPLFLVVSNDHPFA
ncbi:DNA-binding transcriptional LysR family regulator [Paenibacillus qinlingensis]|uniref:DNA-binding transcriptional LysR family regulator n=1 Tax=Paenibacillus qinlingensis TaxID=1837343 RepID=A0ABU1NRE9_9BACL|nr:DNA-binding transcriptional LysR family regulator [Paenibacillus qinlingensis]